MDLELDGKVAWVNGASSGLGRAVATSLAAEGARVAVSARSHDRLQQVAAEIDADVTPFPLDVVDAGAIPDTARRIEEELGPVDILVANAGGPPPGPFEKLGEDELQHAFNLTLASAWRLTKAVVPSMRERKQGVLIYMTSGSTKEVIPNLMLSNMMRAGVVGMAKTLSKELGPDGIRALCVAPGRIQTRRTTQLDEATAESTGKTMEQVREATATRIPLGRYGDTSEFGDVVAFLASARGSYVSGVSVSVDGGLLNGLLS